MRKPSNDTSDEDLEIVRLDLPLDRRTCAWLAQRSKEHGDVRAAEIIAALLRDIVEDDEAAHRVLH